MALLQTPPTKHNIETISSFSNNFNLILFYPKLYHPWAFYAVAIKGLIRPQQTTGTDIVPKSERTYQKGFWYFTYDLTFYFLIKTELIQQASFDLK